MISEDSGAKAIEEAAIEETAVFIRKYVPEQNSISPNLRSHHSSRVCVSLKPKNAPSIVGEMQKMLWSGVDAKDRVKSALNMEQWTKKKSNLSPAKIPQT